MLNGKVAFVAGGSGALGRAIVRTLAREGARVAYSYKTGFEKARQLDESLTATGSVVQSYPLDVLDGKAVVELAETIEKQLGTVDILVNSAGTTHVMPFAMIVEKL